MNKQVKEIDGKKEKTKKFKWSGYYTCSLVLIFILVAFLIVSLPSDNDGDYESSGDIDYSIKEDVVEDSPSSIGETLELILTEQFTFFIGLVMVVTLVGTIFNAFGRGGAY